MELNPVDTHDVDNLIQLPTDRPIWDRFFGVFNGPFIGQDHSLIITSPCLLILGSTISRNHLCDIQPCEKVGHDVSRDIPPGSTVAGFPAISRWRWLRAMARR